MARLQVRSARDDELHAAAALRRAVFVDEMGAGAGAEADRFDGQAEHLVLIDRDESDPAILGTLRVALGSSYTSQEFVLDGLPDRSRPLGEIGRMCLHPSRRGGVGTGLLLRAAVDRLQGLGCRTLVGTASFPGTTFDHHLPALRALRDAAALPGGWTVRPVARAGRRIVGAGRPADMRRVPALVKGYVRAGAMVADCAFIDTAFATIDVCVVLPLDSVRMPRALKAWSQ
ncbi:GNAT family N-acetyltransferase [Jannaschia sp. LMIT008]|uniref:GNAT family N-acetyltransferase n=1 Tax=Jannaschia maritima TaxID=3032585 RepID=UPI002811A32B|nr:GNAT family N-acyltransferase [Jannaschia sp. LMIT008]